MSTCYIRFYGADLTVTYTYNAEKFMLKLSGAYNDIARTFKRVKGIWVEQTELSSVVEDGVRYQNGGEIISPKKTVTITGTGSVSGNSGRGECYVEIDGVAYYSATEIPVTPGTTMKCYVYAVQTGIALNGVDVGETTARYTQEYTHTINENCNVLLEFTPSNATIARITITTS